MNAKQWYQRRYWTKGGALRNVPIGGGCRKNKNGPAIVAASKSSSGKLLKTISVPAGFDYELPPNHTPILWGSSSSSPQSSSHLLSLLRSATTQNPNPSRNPMSSHVIKEEKASMNHLMSSTEPLVSNGHQLLPSLGLCTNSMWRSSNQNQPQQHSFNNGDQNSGMQELYQRLIRSSATANYLSHDQQQRSQPMMLSNAGSNYILESAQALGGGGGGSELGYGWNASFSWPDLSTTNGAYP